MAKSIWVDVPAGFEDTEAMFCTDENFQTTTGELRLWNALVLDWFWIVNNSHDNAVVNLAAPKLLWTYIYL